MIYSYIKLFENLVLSYLYANFTILLLAIDLILVPKEEEGYHDQGVGHFENQGSGSKAVKTSVSSESGGLALPFHPL